MGGRIETEHVRAIDRLIYQRHGLPEPLPGLFSISEERLPDDTPYTGALCRLYRVPGVEVHISEGRAA